MKQVILIMTDTQRKDMLGIYNPKRDMGTPNLDSLAKKGVRYERAYTCQPVCGPARSSIFTGTFPHTNGMLGNSMFLSQGIKTIGQRLKDNNVHAAYIGKWHLDGGDYFGDGICPVGWDAGYWYDMRNYLDEMSDADRFKSRKFEAALNEEIPEEFTYAYGCTAKALDFIEKNASKDFFLTVSYDEPHHPFLAPGKYYERFRGVPHSEYGNLDDDLTDKPEHIKIWSDSSGEIDYTGFGLLGCNSFADSQIGKVLDAIYKKTPDALVIYTSDHGSGLGAHGLTGKGPAVFDEITNIPLIVSWSGMIDPAGVSYNPASHIDIVPTILDYFGIEIPESLEGKSILDELTGGPAANEFVFMEFTRYEIDHDGFGGYQPLRAVTDGRYKLAVNLLTSDELYDTLEDRGELKNLIDDGSYTEIRNRLHDALLKWMNETRDPFRGYCWERRPWRGDAHPATWDYTRMTRQRATEPDETGQLDYMTGLPYKNRVREKGTFEEDDN